MEGNVSSMQLKAEPQTNEIPSNKKNIYVYPITPYIFQKGANNYILNVIDSLGEEFTVINKQTRLGVLDMLFKLPKCNIIYFNWIADLADRRFGYIQIPVLCFILLCCKIFNIQIAWFIHNDISHTQKNWLAKKAIRRMMMMFADVTFSHSSELSLLKKMPQIKVFEHPVDDVEFIKNPSAPIYDALIWGSISAYKGVLELVEFNYSSNTMNSQKILIAGKVASPEFYSKIAGYKRDNIEILDKVVEEDELIDLFLKTRYIVFCYRSASVLSSGALCKTLSYGKTIIGPNIGAFKELGKKGLIYTYTSFEELANLLEELKADERYIDHRLIKNYIRHTSWTDFKNFLTTNLKGISHDSLELSPTPANIYNSAV